MSGGQRDAQPRHSVSGCVSARRVRDSSRSHDRCGGPRQCPAIAAGVEPLPEQHTEHAEQHETQGSHLPHSGLQRRGHQRGIEQRSETPTSGIRPLQQSAEHGCTKRQIESDPRQRAGAGRRPQRWIDQRHQQHSGNQHEPGVAQPAHRRAKHCYRGILGGSADLGALGVDARRSGIADRKRDPARNRMRVGRHDAVADDVSAVRQIPAKRHACALAVDRRVSGVHPLTVGVHHAEVSGAERDGLGEGQRHFRRRLVQHIAAARRRGHQRGVRGGSRCPEHDRQDREQHGQTRACTSAPQGRRITVHRGNSPRASLNPRAPLNRREPLSVGPAAGRGRR